MHRLIVGRRRFKLSHYRHVGVLAGYGDGL